MIFYSPITPSTSIQSLKGKSQPQLIRFSDGNHYVVKFKGNPQGMKTLVNEFIASQLAEHLSLPIPTSLLVYIPDSFVQQSPVLSARSFVGGLQFATQYVEHTEQIPKFDPHKEFNIGTNQETLADLIVFDYWLGNTDRSRRNLLLQRNERGECHFLLIDHGNCFREKRISPFRFRTAHKWCLSLIDDTERLAHSVQKVQNLSNDTILEIIHSVPKEWNVSQQQKESIFHYLVEGKQTLSKLLIQIPRHRDLLTRDEVLERIHHAIVNRHPLSLVRIGNGENIILAQYSILSEETFMKTGTARKWPKHGAGVNLPDIQIRDDVLACLKKVDLVGILPYDDKRIKTNPRYKRKLTEQIFSYYQLDPKYVFDALLFRDLPSDPNFWKLMTEKKIIVISKWGRKFKKHTVELAQQLGIEIVAVYPIHNFYEVEEVLKQIENTDFDIALISAGVGAIVLSQQIAEQYGKVAIDMGHGLTEIAKGKLELPKMDREKEV